MQSIEIRGKNGPVAFAIVDDEDFQMASNHKWHLSPYGYAACKIKNKSVYMHRLITGAQKGMDVDHKNHLKLDNQRSNLRVCTRTENSRNRLPFKRRGLPIGIYRSAKGFSAQITINYKTMHIGTFKTLNEAIQARHSAEHIHFGEFSPSRKENHVA